MKTGDIGLKSVPCRWYLQKLGSGVVKRRSHLGLCGSTAKPKSRSPPSKFRPRMVQRVETNPKCRDQHQDPADGRFRSSFHRSSRFVFLIFPSPPVIPIPANPTGFFFSFPQPWTPSSSNVGFRYRPDLQRHSTSSLHRKRQAQDMSAA